MATISVEPKIFTLINTFTVEAGKSDAVVASLRDVTENVMRTLPGFIGASVHTSTDGTHVANYVQWRTAADCQAMFADPRAQAHMAEVSALATSLMPIAYTVVYVGEVPR